MRQGEGIGTLGGAISGLCFYGTATALLWRLACARFRLLGVAQPLHLGLFGGSDNPFADGLLTPDEPAAELDEGQEAPAAQPAEQFSPALWGAVEVEKERLPKGPTE